MLSRPVAAALFVLLQFFHSLFWWALYASPYGPAFELFVALAGVALLFLWYRADKAALGLAPSAVQDGFVVMLAAVALPVHLAQTRGWKRGLAYVALGVLVSLAAIAAGDALGAWIFAPA